MAAAGVAAAVLVGACFGGVAVFGPLDFLFFEIGSFYSLHFRVAALLVPEPWLHSVKGVLIGVPITLMAIIHVRRGWCEILENS